LNHDLNLSSFCDLSTHGIDVGKYRVSPLIRPLDDGGYTAGVSIRSGRGSATTDRVMRFSGRFATEPDARRHAHVQAMAWLAQDRRVAS
jgi:hypothetical protein